MRDSERKRRLCRDDWGKIDQDMMDVMQVMNASMHSISVSVTWAGQESIDGGWGRGRDEPVEQC